jgi:hypothetical protein
MSLFEKVVTMTFCLIFSLFANKAEVMMKSLPKDSTTGMISYQEIVRVDSSVTKDVLYASAKDWFANAFRSAKDVIQMEDKENAKLIGKGNLTVSIPMVGPDYSRVDFTVTIQAKDGRYKYTVTNFVSFYGNLEDTKAHKWVPAMYQKVNEQVIALLESLKSKMVRKTAQEENW